MIDTAAAAAAAAAVSAAAGQRLYVTQQSRAECGGKRRHGAACAHGVVMCVREVSTGCSTHGWAYTVEVSIDVALVWCWLYCIGCRICPCVRISMIDLGDAT